MLCAVRSVAGIGLWWKTRYLRLTPSFLTITDLKQQTLFASIPTTDFQYCAHVKTNRTRGRRFLIRLIDGQVLQLYTTTTGECVQWVSVINEVIVACDKQRAKNQLSNQRRKDLLLASSASSPNILLPVGMPVTPTSASSLPHIMPQPVSPARAQTSIAALAATTQPLAVTPRGPGKHVSLQLNTETMGGAPPGMQRSSSTGAVVEQRRLERKTSREQDRKLKAAHNTGGAGTGSEPRRAADKPANGRIRAASAAGERREEKRSARREDEYYSGYESYDRRHVQSSRDASDDEYYHHAHSDKHGNGHDRHHSPRYYDDYPVMAFGYPPMPLPVQPPPPQTLSAPPPPPPTQRLLFFFLLFLLFSATILLSGQTYRTSTALRSLYTAHVLQPAAPLYPYRSLLSSVLQCWPFYGLVVSGCYLAYLFQACMWEARRSVVGGGKSVDEVDWLGGSMAGVVCTGCMYFIATHLKSYYDVFM